MFYRPSSKLVSFIFAILVLLFAVGFQVFAAWNPPTLAPPGGNVNVPFLDTGATGQSKVGGLEVNTGNSPNGLLVPFGNVGIGTTAPSQKLEVNGGIRLNTATGRPSCTASTRGVLWFRQGAALVKDSLSVCAKNALDAYAWRLLY